MNHHENQASKLLGAGGDKGQGKVQRKHHSLALVSPPDRVLDPYPYPYLYCSSEQPFSN